MHRYTTIEFRETTQDIQNPQADRRYTRDWEKRPVIKAGQRFRVVQNINERKHIPIYGGSYIYDGETLFQLLIGASKIIVPDVQWECDVYHVGSAEVVDKLIAMGRVTRDEVHDLILQIDNEPRE